MRKLTGVLLLFVLIFSLCVTSCKPRHSFIHKNDKACDHEHVNVKWIIENTRLIPYDEAYEQQILSAKKTE